MQRADPKCQQLLAEYAAGGQEEKPVWHCIYSQGFSRPFTAVLAHRLSVGQPLSPFSRAGDMRLAD